MDEKKLNEGLENGSVPLNSYQNGNDAFEDISSSSEGIDFEDISSSSTFAEAKHYKKKKRNAFVLWWKKLKTWKKVVFSSFLSFLLIIALLVGSLFAFPNLYYNYDNKFSKDPEILGVEQIIDEKIINIALFGVDTRKKNVFTGNTDSIMILSLNTKTKQVKIISVMRDSLVPIVANGKTSYRKINSAYAKSPEVAIHTLNSCFGLDIMEYATVNFFGMIDIIDAIGGVECELTEREVTKDTGAMLLNGCIAEICTVSGLNAKDYYIYKAGKQKLNGVQAVAYSRIRKTANIWGTNNDYGRTDRQRHVMEQLFNKALTIPKSQYMDLINALLPCTKTSLSPTEIYDLAVSILLHSPSFQQTRMPLQEYLMKSPGNPSLGSVVYYDLDFAKKVIHAFIYDDITPEQYIKTHEIEKNNWYPNASGWSPPKPETTPDPEPETPPTDPDTSPETPPDEKPEQGDGDGDGDGNGDGDGDGDGNGDGNGDSSDTPEQGDDTEPDQNPPEGE